MENAELKSGILKKLKEISNAVNRGVMADVSAIDLCEDLWCDLEMWHSWRVEQLNNL